MLSSHNASKNKSKIDVITREVMEVSELQLIETVLGVKQLNCDGGTWSKADFGQATSDESLTASLMQKSYAIEVLNRNIGVKIGKR